MAFTMASAADITVDFSANVDKLPAAESAEVSTATLEGVDFSFLYCKGTGYKDDNYLMVSGKKNTGAYVEFTVPQVTKSFTITTGSSASISVTVQLSANGTNIGEAVKLDAKGADFKFDIPEANQAAGTAYRLTVTNKYNAQITKIVFSDTKGGSTEQPEQPVDPTPSNGVKVTLANSVADGTYALYVPGQGVATVYTGGSAFGYWMVEAVTVADNSFTTDAANLVTFANVAGKGYTMKDSNGKFIGMDASHFGAFNYYETAEEANCYWNLEFTGNDVKISNTGREGAFISAKEYNGKWELVTSDNAETFIALQLFKGEAQQGGDKPTEPELPLVESLSVVTAFPDKTAFEMGVDLSVIYANGAYVYVCDDHGIALIYKNGLGLESGDVIAKGWKGKVSIYNNLIELVPNDATLATTGAAGIVLHPMPVGALDVPYVVTANNQSGYIKLKDVVFETATPAADVTATADRTYTGKMGDYEITFFQRFGLDSYEAGTYDVTGFIAVFKDQVQVYPIKIESLSGIGAITGDANAPVEYFNLQGISVANPENGVFIRRQGSKVQKVVIR